MARLTSGLVAIAVAFSVDQITKLTALAALLSGDVQSVLPFFNLHLSYNEGVSFGLFVQTFAGRPFALACINFGVVVLLAILLFRSSTRCESLAFGAIIGGALGNILDRLRVGAVVDFLDFHVGTSHWPAFNFADTAIAGGVALLIFEHFVRPK